MRIGLLGLLSGGLFAVAGLVLGWSAHASVSGVRLIVKPSSVLVDENVDIRVTGLGRGQKVTLELVTRDRVGVGWRSRTQMAADSHGVIDTHSNMRPFWSMKPLGRAPTTTRFSLTRGPSKVTVRVLRSGTTVATGTVLRSTEASGLTLKSVALADEGFLGTYYSVPSPKAQAALVTLDGSGGGHSELPAALIASHGYPTLSLAYFGEGGLPPTLKNIPLEYFNKALLWLGKQPGVDPQRIAVLGISRGGEAALLLGAYYPDLVHGVIACTSGSQVLPANPGTGNAWTLNGKPIPLGPIPVEMSGARTWVTGGGQDSVFDSAQGVRDILARAHAHSRSNIQGAIYPEAGHAIGCVIPNQPLPEQFLSPGHTYYTRGGSSAANETAAAASWPHIQQLLNSLGH